MSEAFYQSSTSQEDISMGSDAAVCVHQNPLNPRRTLRLMQWADVSDSSEISENESLGKACYAPQIVTSSATSSFGEDTASENVDTEINLVSERAHSKEESSSFLFEDQCVSEMAKFVKSINQLTAYPWLEYLNIVLLDSSVTVPIYLPRVSGETTIADLSSILPIQLPQSAHYCFHSYPLVRADRNLRSYALQQTMILTVLEIENSFQIQVHGVVGITMHVSPYWKIKFLREIIAYNLAIKSWRFTLWHHGRQVFGDEFCKILRRTKGLSEIGVYLH